MTVVFSVSDSGNGFPENKIQFAFDKFYRNTKKQIGSGLGLSIVKVLQAHSGDVQLKNIPSSGALFTVNIQTKPLI
jgi:signal transduction histidine kinase